MAELLEQETHVLSTNLEVCTRLGFYLPNEKPIIGSVRLAGLLTIDTARLFLLKVLSNSSKIKF